MSATKIDMDEASAKMIEAACQARCLLPNCHWTDGLTEGQAMIERMLAERMIKAAIRAAP